MADGAPSEPDVFLSYAREDEARAHKLAEALEQRGFAVFWDREVPVARTWHEHIGKALRAAKCIVVAWSGHSVASDWVIEEASEGKRRRVLAPVLLEEVQPPFGFGGIQAASLIDWHAGRPSREFDGLVAAVQRIVGGQAGSGVGSEAPSAAQPAPSGPAPKASPSPASSEPRAAPMRPSDGWARAWPRRTVVAMVVGLVALAGAGGIVWRLTQPGPTVPTAGQLAPGLSIVGRWRGDVLQHGSRPYSTIMQVNEPTSYGTCGTVDYPELGCGGELYDCEEQSDGSYRMLERLNRGQQQCIDGGTIQVWISGDYLMRAFFYPDGRAGSTVALSRTEAPPLDR